MTKSTSYQPTQARLLQLITSTRESLAEFHTTNRLYEDELKKTTENAEDLLVLLKQTQTPRVVALLKEYLTSKRSYIEFLKTNIQETLLQAQKLKEVLFVLEQAQDDYRS